MKLDLLKQMNAARAERRACVLVTKLADGAQRFVAAESVGDDPLAEEIEAALRAGKSGDGRARRRAAISSPCRFPRCGW